MEEGGIIFTASPPLPPAFEPAFSASFLESYERWTLVFFPACLNPWAWPTRRGVASSCYPGEFLSTIPLYNVTLVISFTFTPVYFVQTLQIHANFERQFTDWQTWRLIPRPPPSVSPSVRAVASDVTIHEWHASDDGDAISDVVWSPLSVCRTQGQPSCWRAWHEIQWK